ncbi:MAG: 23S rRNA (cytidine2498-2'-O)-methyltransferase [Phenylobacterium sp.]|jgi:23S rRNA (cytidine2498-2'-O)-methyltransferase
MNSVLLYCRPGFEKECAAEIQDKADSMAFYGFAKTKSNSGYVIYQCHEAGVADTLVRKIKFSSLIFARQMMVLHAHVENMPVEDRISAIVAQSLEIPVCGGLFVETADTNDAKELSKFCRKFTVPVRRGLRKANLLLPDEVDHRPTFHIMFLSTDSAYVGYSYSYNNSPLSMGITRLRFPSDAPSRSTLKLEEAFMTFIPAEEREERLTSGLKAVDLGASPGGWTYQLVRRGMLVSAIDNGPMDDKLMQTGQVKHERVDGFKFRPKRKNVHWLVCDMIEKPDKVALLMASWLIEGYAKEAIFNLKLPMKKRYDTAKECFADIDELFKEYGVKYKLQAKHLYHDREEITVHLLRVGAEGVY